MALTLRILFASMLATIVLLIEVSSSAQTRRIQLPDYPDQIQNTKFGMRIISKNKDKLSIWKLDHGLKPVLESTWPDLKGEFIGLTNDGSIITVSDNNVFVTTKKSMNLVLTLPNTLPMASRDIEIFGDYLLAFDDKQGFMHIYRNWVAVSTQKWKTDDGPIVFDPVSGRLYRITAHANSLHPKELQYYIPSNYSQNPIRLRSPSGNDVQLEYRDKTTCILSENLVAMFVEEETFSIAELAKTPILDITEEPELGRSDLSFYTLRTLAIVDRKSGITRPLARLLEREGGPPGEPYGETLGFNLSRILCPISNDKLAFMHRQQLFVITMPKAYVQIPVKHSKPKQTGHKK
ncbi:MAG: hypothetical protein ABJA67_04255 [Chthonomonadales bacterium]